MTLYEATDPPINRHGQRVNETYRTAACEFDINHGECVSNLCCCSCHAPVIMPRIGLNEDGSLDEFVAENPLQIHFEAMSENEWWIGVTLADGTCWHIDCGAVNPRAKAYAHAEIR